jgi:hypothetical protein
VLVRCAGASDVAGALDFAQTRNGQVITPEAAEYESARLVFNRAFDKRFATTSLEWPIS